MPCDTISTVSVDLTKMKPDMLAKALTKDGASVSLSGSRLIVRDHPQLGDVTLNMKMGDMRGSYMDVDSGEANQILAQSYGRQAVRAQAKKFGWSITKNGANKFTLKKQSY